MDTSDPYIRKSAALRVCPWLPGERENTLVLARARTHARERTPKEEEEEEEAVSRVGQEGRWPAIRGSKRFLKPDSGRNVSSVGRVTMTRANIPIYRPTRGVRRCTRDTICNMDSAAQRAGNVWMFWTCVRRREEWTATTKAEEFVFVDSDFLGATAIRREVKRL